MTNRWTIAIAGCFCKSHWARFTAECVSSASHKAFGWSISEVYADLYNQYFSCSQSRLFSAALAQSRRTRIVALTGGFLYGLAFFLASVSADKLWWLYLTRLSQRPPKKSRDAEHENTDCKGQRNFGNTPAELLRERRSKHTPRVNRAQCDLQKHSANGDSSNDSS